MEFQSVSLQIHYNCWVSLNSSDSFSFSFITCAWHTLIFYMTCCLYNLHCKCSGNQVSCKISLKGLCKQQEDVEELAVSERGTKERKDAEKISFQGGKLGKEE